jgi:SAM-dependent methyltransferase
MNPLDVETDEVLAFVAAALPPPPSTVLEVGCGDGRLAARLLERGWNVTALDVDAEAVAATRARGVSVVQGDFLSFHARPFDAVLFTRSFHHIAPLADAVAGARDLLLAGGTVLLDEFVHDEIDRFTAAWFFDVGAALAVDERSHQRAHGHDTGHRDPPHDPLELWRWRLHHEPALHGGAAMIEALDQAFELSRPARLPYLHRYYAERLSPDDHGSRLFKRLREREAERIEQGILRPLGLRLVGRRR